MQVVLLLRPLDQADPEVLHRIYNIVIELIVVGKDAI
jgi:hypothetical protein